LTADRPTEPTDPSHGGDLSGRAARGSVAPRKMACRYQPWGRRLSVQGHRRAPTNEISRPPPLASGRWRRPRSRWPTDLCCGLFGAVSGHVSKRDKCPALLGREVKPVRITVHAQHAHRRYVADFPHGDAPFQPARPEHWTQWTPNWTAREPIGPADPRREHEEIRREPASATLRRTGWPVFPTRSAIPTLRGVICSSGGAGCHARAIGEGENSCIGR
jgi:hypothetical protein